MDGKISYDDKIHRPRDATISETMLDEPSGEPERRIRRFVNAKSIGRRRGYPLRSAHQEARKSDMAVCRYCHSLVGDSAGQCFICGWDWHDPTHPVQRGSVSWERRGITAGQQYVVELCESFGGDRFTQFRTAEEEPSDPYYMTETEAVDGARLMELGLNDYVHHLRLRNGDTFSFDENGQWRTTASYKRLSDQETPEWRGDTSTLLPHQAACDAASDHGRSIGLAAFTVIDAVLLDEKGSPVWHVMLEFDDNSDDEWIGFDSFKSVRVDAITGVASSIMSL